MTSQPPKNLINFTGLEVVKWKNSNGKWTRIEDFLLNMEDFPMAWHVSSRKGTWHVIMTGLWLQYRRLRHLRGTEAPTGNHSLDGWGRRVLWELFGKIPYRNEMKWTKCLSCSFMILQYSCGKSNTMEAVSEGTIFDISIVILIEQQIFCIVNQIKKVWMMHHVHRNMHLSTLRVHFLASNVCQAQAFQMSQNHLVNGCFWFP